MLQYYLKTDHVLLIKMKEEFQLKSQIEENPKCLILYMMDISIFILLKIKSLQNITHVAKYKNKQELWNVFFTL